jgi:hypothetical protein
MSSIQPHPLPDGALLRRYVGGEDYADCYATLIDRAVSHEEFVRAFYTTWVFKLERSILRWVVAKPSSDADAAALAAGARETFAAWRVEARAPDQLLMCDFLGNTRSWLMTARESEASTRLYFGSAVVARTDRSTGKRALGPSFRALLGFHKVYSRVLLSAARSRLARMRSAVIPAKAGTHPEKEKR